MRTAGAFPTLLTLLTLLACTFFLKTAHGAPASGVDVRRFEQIEAVRSDWSATSPPSDGWTVVTLPDSWTARWPGFDGVVWYRLRWNESAESGRASPLGLAIEYFNMAGAVYLNGGLIESDARLTEPLSRSWNEPRFWVLDEPLLRPGTNELLIRVSGLAKYQPGLGPVTLGQLAEVKTIHQQSRLTRQTFPLLNIGLTLVMGVLYGMLWLLRRKEVSYGWFSLFTVLWSLYSYNYVAVSPWPFDSTEAYQRADLVLLPATIVCFLMFVLSFCHFDWPRLRKVIFASGGLCIAAVVVSPTDMEVAVRNITVLAALFAYFCGCALIVRHAIASRRLEAVVLAACLMIPLVAGAHDTLVLLEWLPGNRYYAALSSGGTLLGISFALTWRMVKDMRLVEHFNAELQQRVDVATRRLAEGLSRQHAAELIQTRLTERLSLVRDLHDGLGMTLNSHIHTLGNRPDSSGDIALWALREVNDDLRLIIESSAFADTDELAERLVPLRHRCTRLLEAANIECRWQLEGLPSCRLDGKRGLDFLRVLQEALANVLKHSGADHVDVRIETASGQLSLSVQDNGRGFAHETASVASGGMGLQNMHARAARLGGTLEIRSNAVGTLLELRCPIDTAIAA